jgi:putative heme-binding domain-containing protein
LLARFLSHRTRAFFIAALFAMLLTVALSAAPSPADDKPATNPLAGNPEAIKEGTSLFRSNCSPCHGLNARGGGRGPDLTSGRWTHGATDDAIFRTITRGVPGTDMPANDLPESEVWSIIAYLRSLSPAIRSVSSGDATKGSKIFWDTLQCSRCHMVNGKGGLLGPELSRVGASRSDAYLVESIRVPSRDLTHFPRDPNNSFGPTLIYDTVIVETAGGQTLRGIAKNEDTFSVQLLDTDERLHLFRKQDLKGISHERKSLMPAYSEKLLSPADLQDLVAYLETLRGD